MKVSQAWISAVGPCRKRRASYPVLTPHYVPIKIGIQASTVPIRALKQDDLSRAILAASSVIFWYSVCFKEVLVSFSLFF